MGIKFDKFFAKITGSTSIGKAIDENERLDKKFQEEAINAIIAALEDNKINIQNEVKDVEQIQKEEGEEVLGKKQTKKILGNLKNKIGEMKAGYKSKDLTNLLQDEAIFKGIKKKVEELFKDPNSFLQNINNDVVQFIINNKTLLKKYKSSLNFNKWHEFLSGAKMDDEIKLGPTGSDIRKKLYKEKKLKSWLAIFGPAWRLKTKNKQNIEEFLSKDLKKIREKLTKYSFWDGLREIDYEELQEMLGGKDLHKFISETIGDDIKLFPIILLSGKGKNKINPELRKQLLRIINKLRTSISEDKRDLEIGEIILKVEDFNGKKLEEVAKELVTKLEKVCEKVDIKEAKEAEKDKEKNEEKN